MSRRQDRFPFFQSYQSFLPHWDRLPNCTLFLTAHPHARERNLLYLRKLWNMDAWRVRESADFLSLASGRRDGPGVFGDPEKAGAKFNVSNLAVIQRVATASDRSDLKPPWLTASGQTAILLHSGVGLVRRRLATNSRFQGRTLSNAPLQADGRFAAAAERQTLGEVGLNAS